MEQREHEETHQKLTAEVTNHQHAIDLAVCDATKDFKNRLVALTRECQNLSVACCNRTRELNEAERARDDLQVQYDSLRNECSGVMAQRDEGACAIKELMRRYDALLEGYKYCEETIRQLVEDGKQGGLGVEMLRGEKGGGSSSSSSIILLSTTTDDALYHSVKHNAFILAQQREDLQQAIAKYRQHEIALNDRINDLERAYRDRIQLVHVLERDQIRRSGEVAKLEKRLRHKENQLDRAADGTVASIAILAASQRAIDVLRKKVRVLQHESDVLWDFLAEKENSIEVQATEEMAEHDLGNWTLPQTVVKRAREWTEWLTENHKSYYIMH
jgi:chromosome segregation ATPase